MAKTKPVSWSLQKPYCRFVSVMQGRSTAPPPRRGEAGSGKTMWTPVPKNSWQTVQLCQTEDGVGCGQRSKGLRAAAYELSEPGKWRFILTGIVKGTTLGPEVPNTELIIKQLDPALGKPRRVTGQKKTTYPC